MGGRQYVFPGFSSDAAIGTHEVDQKPCHCEWGAHCLLHGRSKLAELSDLLGSEWTMKNTGSVVPWVHLGSGPSPLSLPECMLPRNG